MATFSKNQMRRMVNIPASAGAERILEEKDLGNGCVSRRCQMEQTVTFAGELSKTFSGTIPANSRISRADLYLGGTAAFAGNATKFGLGLASDPDAFVTNDTASSNGAAQPVEATALVTTAASPVISACQSNGSAATGTNTGTGVAKGRLLYSYVTPLASTT